MAAESLGQCFTRLLDVALWPVISSEKMLHCEACGQPLPIRVALDRPRSASLLMTILQANADDLTETGGLDAEGFMSRYLASLADRLPLRERDVVLRHCIGNERLEALAVEQGTADSYMSQLHRRALKRLGALLLQRVRSSTP